MREKVIEKFFVEQVKKAGGKSYKFTSPMCRGVSDRVACMPNGEAWFVELKAPDGRMTELQKMFANDMAWLQQRYACLRSKEEVSEWISQF